MALDICRCRPWRRLTSLALALVVACSAVSHAYAAEGRRQAVLVIDANTGRVLYQRSAEEACFPASLAKLMTLYLLFEQLEQGRLNLTTRIRFSANAAAQPPSNLDVKEGAEIAVIDAIKALIVKSANDVAVAVAEHIAGSEEKFAERMSRKARDLGMTDTVFRNASGLPDAGQVTTARDMIALGLRLYDQFPKYYPLFATRTFDWGGESFRNHNTLLFRYEGLDGMKTGYIRASGFNLVASARRGKKHVLAAYFGGKTAALRNAAVRAHLDAAFAKASEKRTRRPGPLVVAEPARAKPPLPGAPAAAPSREPILAPIGTPPAATAPPPEPASRPVLAAVPGVEVVRVRPVLAEGAAPAREHPRLLALFAGACAAAGANISGAHISTTRDGFALDTFLLAREFELDEDETRRAKRITDTIERLLKGEVRLSELMARPRARQSSRIGAFTVPPEVLIDNALSDQFTVVQVSGLDRPGLLYELTNSLSDLNLDITSAHIATFGERAVDVFYVTDLTNKKVASQPRQKAIEKRLLAVLGAART